MEQKIIILDYVNAEVHILLGDPTAIDEILDNLGISEDDCTWMSSDELKMNINI